MDESNAPSSVYFHDTPVDLLTYQDFFPFVVPLLVVSFLSMVWHEIGHSMIARIFGITTNRLDLGRPALLSIGRVGAVEVRLGLLPLGGRCCYGEGFYKASPLALSLCYAGGWIFDLIAWVGVVAGMKLLGEPDDAMIWMQVALWYLTFVVVVGLTPATSDGRRFLSSLLSSFPRASP